MVRTLLIALFLVNVQAFADVETVEIQSFPHKPDANVTTGDFCTPDDRDFIGYRYSERIPYCVRNVSRHLKARIYAQYNIPERCRHEYTVDHFIPLAMGGSNRPQNLWPEHRNVKATRQDLEQQLYLQLANGEITQMQAVEQVTYEKMNPPRAEPTKCH